VPGQAEWPDYHNIADGDSDAVSNASDDQCGSMVPPAKAQSLPFGEVKKILLCASSDTRSLFIAYADWLCDWETMVALMRSGRVLLLLTLYGMLIAAVWEAFFAVLTVIQSSASVVKATTTSAMGGALESILVRVGLRQLFGSSQAGGFETMPMIMGSEKSAWFGNTGISSICCKAFASFALQVFCLL
jgi:hypothetical protein